MSHGIVKIDSGLSWVACFGAFLIHYITAGTEKAFSVWYVEIQSIYGASAASTSSIIAPLAVFLISVFSIRSVVMCGGILTFFGLLLCSATSSFTVLFLSYGFIYVFTPALIVCTSYFKKRRATALSISLSGAGFGVFSLPALVQFLINKFGYFSAMMIYSSVILNYCVSGALFFPLIAEQDEAQKRKDAGKQKIRDAFKCQALFKDYCFLLFVSSFIFNMMGSGPVTTLLIDYAKTLNLSRESGVFLIAVEGGAQVISRLGSGPIFDSKRLRPIRGYIWAADLAICSMIVVCICLVKSLVSFSILMVFRGLTLALYISQQTLITADMSDGNPGLLNNAVGFTQFCKGIGILSGSFFSGYIKDVTQDYRHAFIFLGVMQFCGCILAFISLKIRNNQKYTSQKDPETMILCEDGSDKGSQDFKPRHDLITPEKNTEETRL